VLGVLHGLEPGHSKTIHYRRPRELVQAALLGFAAMVSRTFVVWVVALIGMHFGSRYYCTVAEPYFQMATITHTRPPHELAHAEETQRRFAAGNATTGQIVMFGLSGGLIRAWLRSQC